MIFNVGIGFWNWTFTDPRLERHFETLDGYTKLSHHEGRLERYLETMDGYTSLVITNADLNKHCRDNGWLHKPRDKLTIPTRTTSRGNGWLHKLSKHTHSSQESHDRKSEKSPMRTAAS